MKKTLTFILISLLICVFITGLLLLCPVYVKNCNDMYSLTFGGPFPYLVAETDMVFAGNNFPRYVAPQYWLYSWQEAYDTYSLKVLPFILSLAVNAAISVLITSVIFLLRKRYLKKHPPQEKPVYSPVFK